eukprot:c6542_g2_i1.p1 GENE.c6542_g2_i1~~c6542_g2_i1.p1  ORF type:complete len:313 (+),score=74.99 c6542_g2_i1:53-991(+)
MEEDTKISRRMKKKLLKRVKAGTASKEATEIVLPGAEATISWNCAVGMDVPNTKITLRDIQNLLLFVMQPHTHPTPKWITLTNRQLVSQTVLVMVPCLSQQTFASVVQQNGMTETTGIFRHRDSWSATPLDLSHHSSWNQLLRVPVKKRNREEESRDPPHPSTYLLTHNQLIENAYPLPLSDTSIPIPTSADTTADTTTTTIATQPIAACPRYRTFEDTRNSFDRTTHQPKPSLVIEDSKITNMITGEDKLENESDNSDGEKKVRNERKKKPNQEPVADDYRLMAMDCEMVPSFLFFISFHFIYLIIIFVYV